MGYFGKFSAVLNCSTSAIAQFFKDYFEENITQIHDNKEKSGLLVYSSENNWVVIKWPRSYFSYDKPSKQISKEFQTVVSVINVYDGDFWEHSFLKDGKQLDSFHSAPDYHHEIDSESLKFIQPGNPQLIAAELKIDLKKIKPYFNRDSSREIRYKKVFPEDVYELMHGLVFIDFWEKLGIRLPEETEVPAYAFELSRRFIRKDNKKAFSGDFNWEL